MFQALVSGEAGAETTKRKESKSLRVARAAIHTTFLANHVYILCSLNSIDYRKFNDPRLLEIEYMEYSQYMTSWNMVMQSVYLVLAVLYDIHLWKDVFNKYLANYIWTSRDFFFTALVAPSTLFVFLTFWSLYLLDRDLVQPPYLDVICSSMLNHSMHSWILVVLMAEIMLQPKLRPKSDHLHHKSLILLYVAYFSVFFAAYYETGLWVYPFFNLLTRLEIFYVVAGMFISMFVFYEMQWFLSGLFWNTSGKRLSKKIK